MGYSEAESTWEPAASLPTAMVKEFEEGVKRDLCSNSYTSGGQTLCTLASVVTNSSDATTTSLAKKLRLECHSQESANAGYAPSILQSCFNVHMQGIC